MQFYNNKKTKGFILLVAVLIASLLLSIGIAIFNTTFKEFRLSSLGKDSQFAFYAADTGIECALYWDIGSGNFGTFPTSTDSNPPSSGVDCVGQDIATSWSITNPTSNSAKTTFSLTFLPSDTSCATIIVSKTEIGGVPSTVVESRGYNTCVQTNSRRVERAVRTRY